MDPGTVVRVGKNVAKQFMRDDVMGLSAELSYRLLFAIFPFFIFLTALAAFITNALDIENPAGRIVDRLGDALPDDVGSVLETQLQNVMETQAGGLISFGALAALWAASGAMNAAVKAMNRAYNVPEGRPFYKKYPRVLGITLIFAFSLIAAVAIVFGAQLFATEIVEFLGLSADATFVVYIIQVPLALIFVVFGVGFLYWAGPNIDVPFKWLTPGAVLFVVVWIVATLGFAFYVSNLADYNATYGALGGVIILMLWFYITSMVLLLGAEFNAVLEEERDPQGIETRRAQKREEAGERVERRDERVGGARVGRSPLDVVTNRPAAAGFGAVVASILLYRVANQR